jgi:hypothetical protein
MVVFGIAVVYRIGVANFKLQGRNNYEIRKSDSSRNEIKKLTDPEYVLTVDLTWMIKFLIINIIKYLYYYT